MDIDDEDDELQGRIDASSCSVTTMSSVPIDSQKNHSTVPSGPDAKRPKCGSLL